MKKMKTKNIPIKKKELEKHLKNGLKQAEIAKIYGVHTATISNWIGAYGLSRREVDTGKVMALHRAKWPIEKIARDVYSTEQEVERIIKKCLCSN